MKAKLVHILFLFMLTLGNSYAQSRQLKGTVTSATDGRALAGVSVQEKGLTVGTQTDQAGNFTLAVNPNALLIFSYIGFVTQEIQIAEQDSLAIALVADATSLEEVVVVGYGTTTRAAFTGSAKRVAGTALQQKNVSSIAQAIAGEVPGLMVNTTTGQPGSETTIRIRGFGSVNGNRDPLYVVDGVPFSGDITSLNSADIESATVLKDAAATAIYGSRGANGVIVISTKNSRNQPSYVEADVNIGTNRSLLPRYDVIRSPEEFIGLAWEGYYNFGMAMNGLNSQEAIDFANDRIVDPNQGSLNIWDVTAGNELIDPVTRQFIPGVKRRFDPENWADHAFQNARRMDINVRFGGSNDKTNYYTSYGYLNDQGYSINSDFKRYTGRVNIDHSVKPWLNVGVNLSLAKTQRNNAGQSEDSGSIFWFVDNIPAVYPLFQRDADGTILENSIYGGSLFDYGENSTRRFGSLTNSIADATYGVDRHNRHEINGRGYVNFTLLPGLTFENSLGYQYYNTSQLIKNDKFFGSSASTNGSLYRQNKEMSFYNFLNLLRYQKSIGDHSIEALAAHEASEFTEQYHIMSGSNLVDPHSLDFNNVLVTNPNRGYTESYALESFFGQLNYDFKKTYLFSASIRRDGSSRFVNNKWGTFGSVGAGWVLTNENFLDSNSWVNFLKLKSSYGVIGDQAGAGFYPGYDIFNIVNVEGNPAFSFDEKGNPDLTWERSKLFQVGAEFELGKWLSGGVEFYVKNTDKLIFERRIGPSIGYSLINVNDGNLRNQGLEFDLTGHLLKGKDYYLDLSINGESFKNKITKMPIDPTTGLQKPLDIQEHYGWSVGHSVYDFYLREFAGVDPADGRSQWTSYYLDENNNGMLDPNEQIASLSDFENPNNLEVKKTTTKNYAQATQFYSGKSAIPKLRGAISLRAGYRNFDLSVQLLYSIGGYAYDAAYAALMGNGTVGGNNWHNDIYQRWQKEGDQTDVPRISNNAGTDQNVTSRSTRFLTKADYIGLNNIRLGYTFQSAKIKTLGLSNLGIWVSGDNLWYRTGRQGLYPGTDEAGLSDMYRYAPLSTFSAGLKAKF